VRGDALKNGCFKDLFATIGCVTVFVIVALGAWTFRDQLGGIYRSVTGTTQIGDLPSDTTVGFPSPQALRAAERKESDIARRSDVGYVTLTADEVASLVTDRLAPNAREAVDSVRVILSESRVTLEGQVRLDVFSRDALGPLAEFLESRQRLRMGGPLTLRDVGVAAWKCDEFVIRSFPFPPSAIPRLVNYMTGQDDGMLLFEIPETVGEVRVRADGISLYRRVD
jgi:hypothetical protein